MYITYLCLDVARSFNEDVTNIAMSGQQTVLYLRTSPYIMCMRLSVTHTRILHILSYGYFYRISKRICLDVVRDFNDTHNKGYRPRREQKACETSHAEAMVFAFQQEPDFLQPPPTCRYRRNRQRQKTCPTKKNGRAAVVPRRGINPPPNTLGLEYGVSD